ncbi:hypothetical protein [Psychrobacillus sp. FSL K6-1464]|uniref:hypothetical protein n=1 Tax=Psychrobacillus sp. FSL K6-1464 TaxID=2921545 RepID=UPI0030F69813
MSKVEVIKSFRDLEDENHVYKVGDKYPRKGRARKERIEELAGNENKIGEPLIAEVGEE